MLAAFTPIIGALSQNSPIFKSKLSAHDFRFQSIELSVDCRTKEERNPSHKNYMHKSRYSPISVYISDHEWVTPADNDTLHKNITETHDEFFQEMDCSKRLAHHILGLFKRSPIPAFENELNFKKLTDGAFDCEKDCEVATDSSGSQEVDDPKEEQKEPAPCE